MEFFCFCLVLVDFKGEIRNNEVKFKERIYIIKVIIQINVSILEKVDFKIDLKR